MKSYTSLIRNILCVILLYNAAYALDNDGYKSMLIVTHDDYQEAADTLAAWRRQMGYTIHIVSDQSWDEDRLKDTTHYYINNRRIDFFVLLGDVDKVPSQSYYSFGILAFTTDLYFACTGDSIDFIPEVGYGRISVEGADQAMAVVHKIIEYERNPVEDDLFYKKALAIGQFDPNKGYAECAETSRNYLISQNYQADKIYTAKYTQNPTIWHSGAAIPDSLQRPNYEWDGDKDQIDAAINDGRFLIAYRDHGTAMEWNNPVYSTKDVDTLENGKKTPIIFSICCTTGQFFVQDYAGLAESFLRHPHGGAVGMIASQTNNGTEPNNAFLPGLIDAIWPGFVYPDYPSRSTLTQHEPIYEMGLVKNQGIIRMIEHYAGSFEHEKARDFFEKYHYHGDPTTKIWTAVPQTITATNPDKVELNTASVTISDISCVNGVATIMLNGKIIGRQKFTNSLADINLEVPLTQSGIATLTITEHNFRPYIQQILIGDVLNVRGENLSNSPKSILVKISYIRQGYRITFQGLVSESEVDFALFNCRGVCVEQQIIRIIPNDNNSIILHNRRIAPGQYYAILKSPGIQASIPVIISD